MKCCSNCFSDREIIAIIDSKKEPGGFQFQAFVAPSPGALFGFVLATLVVI